MHHFKILSAQLVMLADQREAWQRRVDNANNFLSDAGIKHAKAQLAAVKRSYDMIALEIVCLLK